MIIPALLSLSLLGGTADTTVLASLRASFWSRRPQVLLVREGGTSHLVLTARDPQFFARPVLTLYAVSDTAGNSIGVIKADSSAVDARSNTNRHSLRFAVTEAQLRAWADGKTPNLEVGGLRVQLPGGGKDKLRRLYGPNAPRP